MPDSYDQILPLELQEVHSVVIRPNCYTFTPKAGWHWLQKQIFKFLQKIGCEAWDDTHTVNRVRIHKDILSQILKQRRSLASRLDDQSAAIMIGSEDLYELLGQAVPGTTAYSVLGEYYINRTLFKIPVIVVPWMRGVTVIPNYLLPDRR